MAANYNFKEASGLNAAANNAGYDVSSSATSLDSIISTVIALILSFVGVILFVLFIYGAFIWMTAEGNDEKVKKAKSTIKGAVIGLVITLAAYAISSFVIKYIWQQ